MLAWSIVLILTVFVAGAAPGESLGVSNAVVESGKTSLQLPSGAPLYVFALATGGAFPTSGFSAGEFASVTNVAGNTVAAMAITTSNTNSYTTQTSVHAIGGVAVSGFSNYSASYGANGTHGASTASDTFTVRSPGSLVLVIAVGGGEQCPSVAGVPSFSKDGGNTTNSNSIVIGHAYPGPGTYTATETTSHCAGEFQPSNAGDLLGVIVFSTNASSQPQANLPLYTAVIAAVAIVIVIAIAIAPLVLRRGESKAPRPA